MNNSSFNGFSYGCQTHFPSLTTEPRYYEKAVRLSRVQFALCLSAAIGALFFSPALSRAQQPEPPKGFAALFNGADLSGWHGMEHFDPRKLWAMNSDERARKRDQAL